MNRFLKILLLFTMTVFVVKNLYADDITSNNEEISWSYGVIHGWIDRYANSNSNPYPLLELPAKGDSLRIYFSGSKNSSPILMGGMFWNISEKTYAMKRSVLSEKDFQKINNNLILLNIITQGNATTVPYQMEDGSKGDILQENGENVSFFYHLRDTKAEIDFGIRIAYAPNPVQARALLACALDSLSIPMNAVFNGRYTFTSIPLGEIGFRRYKYNSSCLFVRDCTVLHVFSSSKNLDSFARDLDRLFFTQNQKLNEMISILEKPTTLETTFQKIGLKPEDFESVVELESRLTIPTSPMGMLQPGICGYEQSFSNPKIEFQYAIFPDGESAHAAMVFHCHNVDADFHMPTTEDRVAIGLNEKDVCLYFKESNSFLSFEHHSFFIQSGRLLVMYTAKNEQINFPLLKIVLERWHACASKEFLPPELCKTLSIQINESECFINKSIPITYPLWRLDGTQPHSIRLVLISPDEKPLAEHSAYLPGSCPVNFPGGFENRSPSLPYMVVNPCVFTPEAPPAFVHFLSPGRHFVRCYHLDSDGQILAWGETEVEVKDEKP